MSIIRLFIFMNLVFFLQCQAVKKDLFFRADKVMCNQKNGDVEALGNIILSDGKIQVRSAQALYNAQRKYFHITRDVSLFMDGHIISSRELNFSSDFSWAQAPAVYILTRDDSRLTGRNFQKKHMVQELNDISYSPCLLCHDEEPTWQLHAAHVTRNEKMGEMYYEHMWLDLFGVPVFYSPFFMHVDPAINRRSGFLSPRFGYGTYYGFMVATPYYFNLTPDRDLIVTPFGATAGGAFLVLTYRQLFENGYLDMEAGAGYADTHNKEEIESRDLHKRYFPHFFSKGELNFTDKWRLIFDVRRVRDRTYLRRYDFLDKEGYGNLPVLMSHAKIEGFYDKNYAALSAYAFQNLRARSNKDLTPVVGPKLFYQYVSAPGKYGQYVTLDLDHVFLKRDKFNVAHTIGNTATFAHPQQMERFSLRGRFAFPLQTRGGSFYIFNVSTLARFYRLWDFKKTRVSQVFNGDTGDMIPTLSIHWRLPYYANVLGTRRLLVEPVASGVLSIRQSQNSSIPNEDSQDFQLDATTLFLDHRFPGIDAFDTGQRINYGVNIYLFSKSRQLAKFFVGQSYSFTKIQSLPNPAIKAIDKGLSDIVTSIQTRAIQSVDVLGSATLSRRNLTVQRAQLSLQAGPSAFRGRVGYIFIRDKYFNTTRNASRNQVILGAASKLSENWVLSGTWAYDLGQLHGTLSYDMQLAYQNDCFKASLVFVRSFFRDGALKPGNTIMFTLNFKKIGDVTTGPIGRPLTSETKRIHGL